MNRKSFQARLQEEWQRLNPRFVSMDDSLRQSFLTGLREGFHGFWAPLRLLWWLLTRSWK
jgi:hypothetical protein